MTNQMSPPPIPVSRPFSSHQQQPAHSPPAIALPPAKRPRMSPGVSSPQLGSHAVAESGIHGFHTPVASPGFNSPQPYGSPPPLSGAMGPPPRPSSVHDKAFKEKEEKDKEKEKITDINDLSDAIFGSGVDLREEENYLTYTLRNVHGDHSADAQTARSSDDAFRGGVHTNGAFAASGPISGDATSSDDVGAEIERKHRAAAYELARQREKHLKDPFLSGNTIRHHMHKIALEQGVTLDIKGLYEPEKSARTPIHSATSSAPTSAPSSAPPSAPASPRITGGLTIMGPQGTGLASVQTAPHAYLEESSRYADVLSLLSIAANQQIRALLDEAYTLARGRRYGSHGIVPQEFEKLATGPAPKRGSVDSRPSGLQTPWTRPDVVMQDSDVQPKSEDENDKKIAKATLSFETRLNDHLRKLALADRDAELARIRKREERAKRNAARAANAADSTSAGTPSGTGTSTPAAGTPGGTGADDSGPAEKPMTKKERERQAKMGLSEEVLHKNANVTAAMALGFGKSKKKKFSWMTGAAASTPTNPFARPSAPGGDSSATKSAPSKGGSGSVKDESNASGARSLERSMQAQERRWGDWREDGIQGRGIQLRDWATVLERSGREKKALEKCLLNMDKAADGTTVK